MLNEFPPAFIIASREAVSRNNNVLYRLVRPLPDGSGVESVDRLVNVVPHRRSYCMERKKEIDDFRHEILLRPLVLQPILHFGRGFSHYCGTCYTDEPWVIMVNQTHPKVLSRLQMGLDMAKSAIERGQSVEIRFDFGAVIQRVYREYLRQKEQEEAKDSVIDEFLVHCRYAEWEHCSLIVRSHGYAARLNRSAPLFALPNLEFKFKFEDIAMHEMVWSQLDGQAYPKPHLARITEDEIRAQLPGWTINSISPLADIGEVVPEFNYSYAQAGRLYESFRKKKRTRNVPPQDVPGKYDVPSSYDVQNSNDVQNSYEPADYQDTELQGAVGYDTYYDYTEPEDDRWFDTDEEQYDTRYTDPTPQQYSGKHHRHNDSGVEDDLDRNTYTQRSVTDKQGHINANVVVKSNNINGARQKVPKYPAPSAAYDKAGPSSDYHRYEAPQLKKQDSDRSSRSTNADSGYSPETEGHMSREGSYDYNDSTHVSLPKPNLRLNDGLPLLTKGDPKIGLYNPSFQDYDTVALQKHRELVSNVLREQKDMKKSPGAATPNKNYNSRLPESAVSLSPKELLQVNQLSSQYQQKPESSRAGAKVAESYI